MPSTLPTLKWWMRPVWRAASWRPLTSRQPLSALNPISHTVGWDGGMLAPGRSYRRQMDSPGLYSYSDELGHQGQVCVTLREDVNGDGFVDLLDIQAVAAAWGSLAPDGYRPRW